MFQERQVFQIRCMECNIIRLPVAATNVAWTRLVAWPRLGSRAKSLRLPPRVFSARHKYHARRRVLNHRHPLRSPPFSGRRPVARPGEKKRERGASGSGYAKRRVSEMRSAARAPRTKNRHPPRLLPGSRRSSPSPWPRPPPRSSRPRRGTTPSTARRSSSSSSRPGEGTARR